MYGEEVCVGNEAVDMVLMVTHQRVIFVREASRCMVRSYQLMTNMTGSCLDTHVFCVLYRFSSFFSGHEAYVLSS